MLNTGKAAFVCAASACGHGNEERHHIAGRGPVSQDLHTKTRTS